MRSEHHHGGEKETTSSVGETCEKHIACGEEAEQAA
jgi:hypothetical protein